MPAGTFPVAQQYFAGVFDAAVALLVVCQVALQAVLTPFQFGQQQGALSLTQVS
jgi:hypothetical protein